MGGERGETSPVPTAGRCAPSSERSRHLSGGKHRSSHTSGASPALRGCPHLGDVTLLGNAQSSAESALKGVHTSGGAHSLGGADSSAWRRTPPGLSHSRVSTPRGIPTPGGFPLLGGVPTPRRGSHSSGGFSLLGGVQLRRALARSGGDAAGRDPRDGGSAGPGRSGTARGRLTHLFFCTEGLYFPLLRFLKSECIASPHGARRAPPARPRRRPQPLRRHRAGPRREAGRGCTASASSCSSCPPLPAPRHLVASSPGFGGAPRSSPA